MNNDDGLFWRCCKIGMWSDSEVAYSIQILEPRAKKNLSEGNTRKRTAEIFKCKLSRIHKLVNECWLKERRESIKGAKICPARVPTLLFHPLVMLIVNSHATSSSFNLVFVSPNSPADILSLTQPQQTATSFFKIASGEAITFRWNMTYVLTTSVHLMVFAVYDNWNMYPAGPTDHEGRQVILSETGRSCAFLPFFFSFFVSDFFFFLLSCLIVIFFRESPGCSRHLT